MKKFTIATLRTKDMSIPSVNGKNVTFKSARLDKLFKDINKNICVDVAVFSNTFNITVWIAGTSVYYRTKYSRELDNSLGILLLATHKMLQVASRSSELVTFLDMLTDNNAISPIIEVNKEENEPEV